MHTPPFAIPPPSLQGLRSATAIPSAGAAIIAEGYTIIISSMKCSAGVGEPEGETYVNERDAQGTAIQSKVNAESSAGMAMSVNNLTMHAVIVRGKESCTFIHYT